MVKISDFFKKESSQPEEEPKAEPQKSTEAKIPIKEIQKETMPVQKSAQDFSIKVSSDVMLKKMKVFSLGETEQLYRDCLDLIKVILDRGLKGEPIELQKIKEQIEKLVDQLCLGNTELIVLTNSSSSENYLYAHSVNVCIISILLGTGFSYARDRLSELGLAAFLHDIGMVKLSEITQKTERITEGEYSKIKDHPIFGVNMLEMVKDISKTAIYVAREHHEWLDGKGYPRGLKGKQIDEYTRIVTIADAYEALTHPRSYHNKLQPYDAVREILKDKERFDSIILKVLIEKMGVFPIGSWVALSTEEAGVVVDVNKDFPLKPTIKILFDAQGRKLSEEKLVNLIEHPALYIRKPINADDLSAKQTRD